MRWQELQVQIRREALYTAALTDGYRDPDLTPEDNAVRDVAMLERADRFVAWLEATSRPVPTTPTLLAPPDPGVPSARRRVVDNPQA